MNSGNVHKFIFDKNEKLINVTVVRFPNFVKTELEQREIGTVVGFCDDDMNFSTVINNCPVTLKGSTIDLKNSEICCSKFENNSLLDDVYWVGRATQSITYIKDYVDYPTINKKLRLSESAGMPTSQILNRQISNQPQLFQYFKDNQALGGNIHISKEAITEQLFLLFRKNNNLVSLQEIRKEIRAPYHLIKSILNEIAMLKNVLSEHNVYKLKPHYKS